MPITKLQKTGVIEILLFLHKRKKASRTELRDNINAVLDTIYQTSLPTLKELGLIEETKSTRFPFTVHIFLTEKGKKVAEKLMAINELMGITNSQR